MAVSQRSVRSHAVTRNDDLGGVPPIGCTQDFVYRVETTVDLPVIVRGDGIYVWDVEGRRYLDASSGPICSNIGHCHPVVASAMYEQALKLDFSYSRLSRTVENLTLSARVAALAGPGFERVIFFSGGSEATDMALKLVRQYRYATGETRRTKVICQMPSYHGMTLSTLAVSGDTAYEPVFGPMAVFAERIPAPITFRSPHDARAVEQASVDALDAKIRALGAENVLAFIVEPVGGLATGCLAPSANYFAGVRRVCDRHGVAVIFDEVMSGGGRTGRFLAAHRFPDGRPDVVCLGKGLGAGYAPLSAVLAPAAWIDALRELTGFNFAHTANANPISCAVGHAVLDVIEQEDLIARAESSGEYLRRRLTELASRHSIVGDIRGRGLLLAMELCRPDRSRIDCSPVVPDRMRQIGLRHGLLLYARLTNGGRYGDWVMVTPPLTISRSQIDEYVAALDATLVDLQRELRAAHLLD